MNYRIFTGSTALIIALLLGGCITPSEHPQQSHRQTEQKAQPFLNSPYPAYEASTEQSVPEWIGKDYHDVSKISMLMSVGRRIEDMGNGRKRIEFSDLPGGSAKVDYVIKTDEQGIITYATQRWFDNFK
jgi:hypothetical protein